VAAVDLGGRGYAIVESTLAMGMSLDPISLTVPEVELGPLDWPEYLEYLQIVGAPGLLSASTRARFTPSWRGTPARTSRRPSP